ncbi:MAG: IS5/IS1182 family transposase, partial [Acaryochloris sp. CRU_2_0]|nr:IS5/IS1182 family transposase [Acaryochloris sp. CRU_2_0]
MVERSFTVLPMIKNPLHYIYKYPQRSKRVLGIEYDQFLQLLEQAELKHNEQKAELERHKSRVNAQGGGRKPLLSVAEEVCLCLFYLRHYPTFEVLGLQFGVSNSEANDTVHYGLAILRVLLPASLLEQVESHRSDYAIVQEWLTQFQLIVDSFEQARERPRDNDEQRSYFSGKKQQHTFKSQIVTLPGGKDIVDATAGEKEPTSDICVFRERQSQFARRQGFEGDKAYVGAENVQTPHKKPRGKELTPQQKAQNKEFSSTRRIFVEHMIPLVRIFRVAQERFRLRHDTYEQVIL